MKFQVNIVLIIFLALSTFAIKPGTILGLKEEILNKARDQFFPFIMLGLQMIDFEDVVDGSVRLAAIVGSLTNEDATNCKIGFAEDRNLLLLNITGFELKLHMNWLKSDIQGVADVSGNVKYTEVYLSFDTIKNSDDDLAPQIHIEEVNMLTNEEDFTYDFSCSDCSESFKQDIEEALKDKLIDSIKSEAKDIAINRVENLVNSQLELLVPQRLPITPDITIDLSSTDNIEVKSDFLAVPIDSTIFLNEDGYNRPVEAPDISIIDPENPGDMLLFSSNYVYK